MSVTTRDSVTGSRYLITTELLKTVSYVLLFLLSIDLMGQSFKTAGSGLTSLLAQTTDNPIIGLFLGIVVTSIVQSSSSTTSIIVAMVGAGTLSIRGAIPLVMGANIGTTVTNTIVSFGYAGRKTEFERAFGASIVHDMFNIYATIILFPLEQHTRIIEKSAILMVEIFRGIGGFEIVSPLIFFLHPLTDKIVAIIPNHFVIMIVSFTLMFISLSSIVRNTRSLVMKKAEELLNTYLFRNAVSSLMFGLILTSIVQSSSITTSLIVPLAGSGILTMEQIFPYTLGANVGTTITAILAALTIGLEASMAVAFSHFLFNVFGIAFLYPIKRLPIMSARIIARFSVRSKKHFALFIIIYISLHIVPIAFAFLK